MAEAKRLKSKMKRADPESFTIHDFLAESKTSDSADSRFDGSAGKKNERTYFVLGVPPIKLGNLYREVGEQLESEKGWKRKKDDSGRFNLILGGPRGSGIPFKRFAQLFRYDYGIIPHCNYFRGHAWLTQKVKLVQVLRQAELEHLVPESFLFFPSSSDDNETDDFRSASEGGAKRGASKTWIARASDASKGERTLISGNYDEIVGLIDSQEKTSSAWVVQEYIQNPLLLPGGKKCDFRFLVLVDSDLDFHLCSESIVKQCSDKFSMDDLSNKLAHLSCEAIQRKSESMPAEQFAKWLSSEHGVSYDSTVVEPAKAIIGQVLEAAKSKLQTLDHADFTSFQVFAFDFILDAKLKIHFIECSAPTKFPDELVRDLAKDIVDIAVKPTISSTRKPQGRLFQPIEPARRPSRSNNKK